MSKKKYVYPRRPSRYVKMPNHGRFAIQCLKSKAYLTVDNDREFLKNLEIRLWDDAIISQKGVNPPATLDYDKDVQWKDDKQKEAYQTPVKQLIMDWNGRNIHRVQGSSDNNMVYSQQSAVPPPTYDSFQLPQNMNNTTDFQIRQFQPQQQVQQHPNDIHWHDTRNNYHQSQRDQYVSQQQCCCQQQAVDSNHTNAQQDQFIPPEVDRNDNNNNNYNKPNYLDPIPEIQGSIEPLQTNLFHSPLNDPIDTDFVTDPFAWDQVDVEQVDVINTVYSPYEINDVRYSPYSTNSNNSGDNPSLSKPVTVQVPVCLNAIYVVLPND